MTTSSVPQVEEPMKLETWVITIASVFLVAGWALGSAGWLLGSASTLWWGKAFLVSGVSVGFLPLLVFTAVVLAERTQHLR